MTQKDGYFQKGQMEMELNGLCAIVSKVCELYVEGSLCFSLHSLGLFLDQKVSHNFYACDHISSQNMCLR
jgi:hypothetical protein